MTLEEIEAEWKACHIVDGDQGSISDALLRREQVEEFAERFVGKLINIALITRDLKDNGCIEQSDKYELSEAFLELENDPTN